MPPSRLGPLALDSKLGDHPSLSHVWRAIHVDLKRPVAVKIFPTPFGGTAEARKSLADEWTMLQGLSHPAIAKCYGGGFERSDAYLAYEFIDGETLSAQLERRGRLPWETVLDIADAMVDALKYLHAQGVVHGAVFPSKILVAGLSAVLLNVRRDRMTSAYSNRRAPSAHELALMPPERLLHGGDVVLTPSNDLYCLAASLYLALTGRPPLVGSDADELAQSAGDRLAGSAAGGDGSTGPAPPSSIVMDIPVWLDKWLCTQLSANVNERPASAEVAAMQLAEARRRSVSRTSVAAATSAGFSPLDVDNQSERDQVRKLLGRDPISYSDDITRDGSSWFEKAPFLIVALLSLVGITTWLMWPLSEDELRRRAEQTLATETRASLSQARSRYLEPMLRRFPDGEHADWARGQLDEIDMLQAENALQTKLKRRLRLGSEAERLYARASEFEQFGDRVQALDDYRAIVELFGDDPESRPFVNLARRQIAAIQNDTQDVTEGKAAAIINRQLEKADGLYRSGETVAAKRIWYSIVELYDGNEEVAGLVEQAQAKLQQ